MQMLKSELVIVDYMSTAHLEAMVMNHPVLILSSPDSYLLNKENKGFYDILIEAKILYLEVKEAVEFLNENHGNYFEWWNSREIQNARMMFLEKNLGYNKDFKSLIKNIGK